jgi:hypothetical protein
VWGRDRHDASALRARARAVCVCARVCVRARGVYACVRARARALTGRHGMLACSMLFDSQLKVPETHSAIHLKDREKAKLDDPFNARKLKELEKKELEKKAKELEKKAKNKKELVWSPTFEVCDGIEEGSAASMVQPAATAKPQLEVCTLCSNLCIVVMCERF